LCRIDGPIGPLQNCKDSMILVPKLTNSPALNSHRARTGYMMIYSSNQRSGFGINKTFITITTAV